MLFAGREAVSKLRAKSWFFPRMKNITFLAFLTSAAVAQLPEDFRFKVDRIGGGFAQPMELEIAGDGRIFVNEYGGKLKILRPDSKEFTVAGELKVFGAQENGFLGFALDPKFSENGWIYCLYSPVGYDGQSLSRFTMKGDLLDVTSEKVLLRYEEQRKECCHHAGSVEFGPDGNLYWSAGDNTHPHGDSEGYAPIDEREGKSPWDAQKSAANTMSLAGKINRIRPSPDRGYEIPAGNLFPVGTPKARPEIFAMGCRNPWRMSVDQKTGFVYWGEVGPDAGGDGKRGPRGYDEINQAKKSGNFGWPYFIGKNFAYPDFDYATKTVGKLFDPAHPINEGPNNTGLRDLPPATPAFLFWPYGASEFGEGGRTACAGPVYYSGPSVEKADGFPHHFSRCLLFWDWERPFIKWARLDENSDLVGVEAFTSAVVLANKDEQVKKVQPLVDAGATLVKRPVDAEFDKDGVLYLLDYGATWGANADSQLLRIRYVRGNLPPTARASVTPAAGREPLAVTLSGAGSRDPEGDALKYEWTLQPGGKILGSGETLRTTITDPGSYTVELRTTDAKGASAAALTTVIAGNSLPTVSFDSPKEGDFFTPGVPVKFNLSVTDLEDGESAKKPDEFGVRTMVSGAFVRADGKQETSDPGLSRMKQSDCFNCHGVEQKILGPTFLEVADKYRGQAGAADLLNKKVREGGNGVWGQIPMLPHPQHTLDEVAIMLRWVLALEKGKGGPVVVRGLAGELIPAKSSKPGNYVLEAVFTDAGRGTAGSLSGKAAVAMRSRRVEAELGEVQGARILGAMVGAIDHGHHVKLGTLNLAGTKSVVFHASSGNVGGKIELRSGSPTGELLATVDVPNTGGWDKYIDPSSTLASTPRAEIYAVFVNPGKSGLLNLDWVEFVP